MEGREEVGVAAGGEVEGAECAAVDRNHVIKPQGQIGKIFRQNSLYLAVQKFSFFLIHLNTNLVRERVDARIAVVSTVRAIGRKPL